ncbi:hypothetical protein CRG98_033166 [Punica granatum]|uniref:Uncharacterized protein n=1 Tax=Punica granatum TaxID=22663 RepID=A0A2I0IR53_PUNGR|nr:hypothetical protein CRG98_033166 [Punica granatum]
MLARASYNLAGSAHPCELSFLLCKFVEPARLCVLQPRRVCSPVLVYFSASKVRRAYSLVPLATLPGLLTRASLLFCFASSPSMLARASYNLAGSAHPCELSFLLCKFVEPARLCVLQPRRVCSPVLVYFSASKVRRACSLVPLATLPGLLARASLLFCLASSSSMLAGASYNFAGFAHPCEFTFLLSKFTDHVRSCLLQPCRVCLSVRVNFSASQVRRGCSLVPLATLPGLLTPSPSSMLARASYNFAGSAHPCEFTFLRSKFVEHARSCLLQPCRVYSPDLLTRASLLFCLASSPSMLARASYNFAGSAHPCEFTFLRSKFVEHARPCLLQPCRVYSPVRVYFCASQVRRACSLLPLVTLPGLLTRANLLFCLASSPSMLARASYNLAGSTHPCEFTFLLRKFGEPTRSCLLQPCQVCSPVRVNFSASQVRRACSLVPLATLSGLLTRASLLFCFGSSPSQLAPASCNLAWPAHPCEFTFQLSKFVEPARSCLLQHCRVYSPVRVYFFASEVPRASSLLPLATLPGLLTRASLLFSLASSSSLLARASCNLARSAHPCEFTFLLRKFAEPARSCLLQLCQFAELGRSCLLQPCRVCSPVGVYFSASKVRRACSLVPLATLSGLLTRASLLFCLETSPGLLARASCNLVGSAHPCEFTFLLSKFTEHARSCLLQPSWVCSPVRVIFSASQVRRTCSLVRLTTSPGQLTRASLLFCFESSPSLLPRASCNLAGSAHRCEFTFVLRNFAEPARSCLFSPSQLARASFNLAGSAHPCELTFLLRKFTDHARSCFLQPCRVCSPVRVYFSA